MYHKNSISLSHSKGIPLVRLANAMAFVCSAALFLGNVSDTMIWQVTFTF